MSTVLSASPLPFSPVSLTDSLDETHTLPGGMTLLADLIPDPSTKDLWVCRPAAVPLTAATTANFVILKDIGSLIYGMRNSLTFSGYDEPFCYNVEKNLFLPISNIKRTNLPLTQKTQGDWVPPTIDVVGVNVIFTHPGFDGVSNFIGWVDTSDPTSLIWRAGNLQSNNALQALGSFKPGSGYVNGTYNDVPLISNSIKTFDILTGGTGYIDGIYKSVSLTGGSGRGAVADITVSSGAVSSVVLVKGGVQYTDSDVVSASSSSLGGSGTGFSIKVATISSGSGATANITIVGTSVDKVVLLDYGSNYNLTDQVTANNSFLGGSGSGFLADVLLVYSGQIVFTTKPDWVVQYGQRAWFGVNPEEGQPSAIFTDILFLNCSNANQALTFGDNLKLTSAIGNPLNNQSGGIIQSLFIFKGVNNIFQVTGDLALGNLAINSLNISTGTLSPWATCKTPKGIAFLSPEGYRIIDSLARISDPIGTAGMGVVVPFQRAVSPTRIAAECNASIIRISVQTPMNGAISYVEYWYDLTRNVWSGPHTFPATTIVVYNNTFLVVGVRDTTTMYRSDPFPTFNSVFIELGTQMTFSFKTVMLGDPGQMAMMNVSEMTINMALSSNQGPVTITATDENSIVYNSVIYTPSGQVYLWGSAIWGQAYWGGTATALRPRRADFNAPIVYRRISIGVTANSGWNFKIGDIFIRRQILGYTQAVS